MKKLLSIVLITVIVFSFAACTDSGNTPETPAEKTDINFFVLTGPTGIGAVHMMQQAQNNEGLENYHITAVAAPDEIVSKISNGDADIAAISTNLAAKLYNITGGEIEILAVNTLGVLYAITNENTEIAEISDLAGKTAYTTGKGANPEYIINFLLKENGLTPASDLQIEYVADGSKLTSVWAQTPDAVIIAPQPVATAITLNYENAEIALDLTEEWDKVSESSALMMGCIVARKDFIEENPQAVENFLTDYKASVSATETDPESTASLCETYGIVAKAAVAQKALPYCNICFITGEEMKTKLTGYLEILLAADPQSVGGAIPADDFWYPAAN